MIEIENLKKIFVKKAGRKDFRLDIKSLSIKNNEIIYFIGPNGSGKTTLLALIQGQIEPNQGFVYVKSSSSDKQTDLLSFEAYERAKYLGFVPQNSDDALINEMNIIDHVLLGLVPSKQISWFFPRKKNIELVRKILSQFNMGFEDRLNESVGNLSGGERQVLSFCLATLNKPEILLLDEFTAGLDPKMAAKVLELVISFIRDKKFSALIVTHRHREAVEHADRIVILHRGKPYKELRHNDPKFNEIALKKIFTRLYSTD